MNSFDQAELDALAADNAPVMPVQFIVEVTREHNDGLAAETYENDHSDLTDAKLDAQAQHASGATKVQIVSNIDSRVWRVSPKTGKLLLVRYSESGDNTNLHL